MQLNWNILTLDAYCSFSPFNKKKWPICHFLEGPGIGDLGDLRLLVARTDFFIIFWGIKKDIELLEIGLFLYHPLIHGQINMKLKRWGVTSMSFLELHMMSM